MMKNMSAGKVSSLIRLLGSKKVPMKKRLLLLCLTLGATLSLSANAMAVEKNMSVDASNLASNEELYSDYVNHVFGIENDNSSMNSPGIAADLDESTRRLFDYALVEIQKMASGQRASAEITFAFDNQAEPDVALMVQALLYECPYEMYWFDKAQGYDWQYLSDNEITISFYVTQAYAGSGDFTLDTQKTSAAANAVKNADRIIEENAHLGDYEKIRAYKNRICELVSYDADAAAGSYYGDDPWQIISVFDEDSSTNVVCEGYAKAFQYLMDNSSFNSNKISSIIVEGTTLGSSIGMPDHMWNVVKMEDGKNYIVDVTNSDEGGSGYLYDGLFLVGGTGEYAKGYTVKADSSNEADYAYGDLTLGYYLPSQLEISNENYIKNNVLPTDDKVMPVGNNIIAVIENGVVTLSGKGKTWGYSYVEGTKEPPFKDLGITRAVVTAGVTDLDSGLFDNCKDLKSVQLPDGLKSIGSACFWGCSNLTEINIPNGVESIGYFAFQECKALPKVSLPESVTEIGSSAFAQCENLTSLNIPEKVTRIESNLIDDCAKLTHINIPAGVTFIDFSAFANSGITSIKLPDKLESIEEGTFWFCRDLKTVEIPENVKRIGSSAFFGTKELTVIMYEGVEDIADDAFELSYNPKIYGKPGSAAEAYAKKHDIPFFEIGAMTEQEPTETSQQEETTESSKDPDEKEQAPKVETKLTHPGSGLIYSVTKKGKEVCLKGTSKKKKIINIPKEVTLDGTKYKVTAIASNAFKGNKDIREVTIGNKVAKIGEKAFSGCTSLKKVKGGTGVTSIKGRAFYGCSKLSAITIGSKVTSIGDRAFAGCISLKKIIIPASVKSIGKEAFLNCKKLSAITIKTIKLTGKKVGKNAFKKTAVKATVKVPKKVKKAYKVWLPKKGVSAKAKIIQYN